MVTTWSDTSVERAILNDISTEEPWRLLERFSSLVRLSGSEQEDQAVQYITGKLSQWGVPHKVHHPTTLISLSGPASLRTLSPTERSFTVKTSSFSPSTNGQEITGELVYVPGRQ